LPRVSSAPWPDRLSWGAIYTGVALTTLATLVLELSLTRIFSVVFYYHFAFLAISIALFGLGAGGVFSYVVAGWRGGAFAKLGSLALANGAAVVLALAYIMSPLVRPGGMALIAVYFVSALPFFLAGAVVSLVISETISRVDRVYFFDLAGAAGGCLALIPMLNYFGGPNTVIGSAVVYCVASAIWFNLAGSSFRRAAAVVAALCLVALMVLNGAVHILDVKWAKGRELPDEFFVRWNSFSRIGIAPEKGNPGVNLIYIDADASTGIPPYDWDRLDEKTRHNLLYDGPGIPYVLRPAAKTLVIGPGGGWDIARSFASGSKDITGVEINPIIANTILRQRYPDLNRRLYFRPEVHIDVEDGRSFVRRSAERYEVIQATLVDTWASTAAGAFALSENNLYTTDAFNDYLTHLTGNGLMVFTRWGFQPPRESLRLLSLAMVALDRLGERDPARHVIVLRGQNDRLKDWGAQDTVLISRKPFSEADVDCAKGAAAIARMTVVYVPGDGPSNEFGKLLASGDPQRFSEAYAYNVTPVSDDQPFFFYTVQTRDVWNFVRNASTLTADYKVNRAVPMLFGVIGVSLIATALILVLPRLLLGSRLPADRSILKFLWYFLLIGAGYILIQVALIQKFVLFLGHPTYALSVIIFSMLVASGAGSFASRWAIGAHEGRLKWVFVGVSVLVVLLALVAAPVTGDLVGLPLAIKALLTAAMIAPAAFLMGMPFPTGLGLLERAHHESVRWAWALNAASSVLGSASAIFLAIYIGLRATLVVGACFYVLALLVYLLARPQVRAT
jgi:hypothetical protein